ncbi:hypothetical protein P4C99_08700 [Pontiellaceae bacterium B1224]|nr:hypothetical protein [Pontiellaceae bacterium B1224]
MQIKSCFVAVMLSGVTAASVSAEILYQDTFDNDSLAVNMGIGGGAANHTIQDHAWADDGNAIFVTSGTNDTGRAILYSANSFQSDSGFRLSVNYTTGFIGDEGAHNLSFGLISSDTDCSTYSGFNPFLSETGVYSIGANVIADDGTEARGLHFTDGSIRTTLDASGTRAGFKAGETCEVTIEIGIGGYWCYRIDGIYEASGVLLDEIDLSKNYQVVVYGQDDDGGGTSIQSVKLETAYVSGERAAGLRGTWASIDHDAVEQLSDFKTLDTLYARFNDGATASGNHFVPHKLLERLALEGYAGTNSPITSVVPSWGDLNLDEPETDVVHDQMKAIKAAGFKVKVYSNSEQFIGANSATIEEFVVRWKEWCDNDPEALAFIASQPFHTNVWNSSTQKYDTAGPVNRKYMFCYAEFVLKDFALRYGHLIDSWIWDSAADITSNGDKNNGLIEDQRIFQAFANAVHAGNPEIPLAFNLGRSTGNYSAYPFQRPTHFDDFTFGHAFGGNNDHATGTQFNLNYQHITRMTETDGYVHVGGNQDFDELVVGNMHSKLGPISWRYSNPPSWLQNDFNQWNLEALQAGGTMTWSGSTTRGNTSSLYSEAYALLKGLDDYLAQYESPGTPNWARAYTILPDAVIGEAYYHVLVEGEDFWDPEGDDITSVVPIGNAPFWLTIQEDPTNSNHWILSGIPTGQEATTLEFTLEATETNGLSGSRNVELVVLASQPVQTSVQILATANTSYGTDVVATLYSAVQTAPDGLATFRIAIDVDPMEGTSITSGPGSEWGINAGEANSGWWTTFDGSLTQSVDSVSNIRIVDFSANGGDLTRGDFTDLSFQSVAVLDGQHSADRVKIIAGGVTNAAGGIKMASSPETIDLQTLAESASVPGFILGNGNLNSKNRWTVGSIDVSYAVNVPAADGYTAWVSGFGLESTDASPNADPENSGLGDGYDNLAEYALGMNPTNSDAGSRDWINHTSAGGTNWFEYIHYRRSDYAEQGLGYLLIDSTNLVGSVVSTNAQDYIFIGPPNDGYETVTNRYEANESQKFIRLDIRQD